MRTRSPARAKNAKRKILIVEDHPIMGEGLALTVGKAPDFVVCGRVETAREAMEVIGRSIPDVVLADLTLPDKSGLELIKDLQAQYPDLPVLVLSMHDETLYAERALRAGAKGYIMKQASPQTLLDAIRQVYQGEVYVSEKMVRRIITNVSGKDTGHRQLSVERLTDRQIEVLQLIGAGKNRKEIAEQLHLSPKTVAVHEADIKERLGLASVRELVRYAVSWMEKR